MAWQHQAMEWDYEDHTQLLFQTNLKFIWVRSRNCGCLVTWFCYPLIAKPGNKTAAVWSPDPYLYFTIVLDVFNAISWYIEQCYERMWWQYDSINSESYNQRANTALWKQPWHNLWLITVWTRSNSLIATKIIKWETNSHIYILCNIMIHGLYPHLIKCNIEFHNAIMMDRDHFSYAPSQWEAMLWCNIVSHWLGAYKKWSLIYYAHIMHDWYR